MGYHETFPDQQTASSSLNFASASAIRNALKSGFGTNEILGELPDNAASVSYTHLDVYKRQYPILLAIASLGLVSLISFPSFMI